MFCASCATTPVEEFHLPSPLLAEVEDLGLAEEPSIARARDGSLYVAWVSLRDGADTLQVARYARKDSGFTRQGIWEADGGNGNSLLGPRAILADDGVFIVYAAERGGNWNIYAVECDPDGPGAPIEVSSHAAVDVAPAAAFQGQSLYVAWEANRQGERQILFDTITASQLQGEEQVSVAGSSNYAPAVAVGQTGQVSVAWQSWREDNYDIYIRQRQPSGRWTFERRLTHSPGIDRNVSLAANADDIWIAYENSNAEGYATGIAVNQRIMVAKVTADGMQQPVEAIPPSIAERARRPVVTFDPNGRLWLAYLRPSEEEQSEWFVYLTGFTGAQWIAPLRVATGKGLDRQPALQHLDEKIVLAYQNDDFPESRARAELSLAFRARSWIVLGAVALTGVTPSPQFVPTEPLKEASAPFEAASARIAFGEDLPTAEMEYQGESLQLSFGDLHAHSNISGDNRASGESVNEEYRSRRDIYGLDFAAVTDHGYDLTPYLWSYSAKMVRVSEDPGRFLPFLAQEWTSGTDDQGATRPSRPFGRRSVIFANTRVSKWWNAFDGQTPEQLWGQLEAAHTDFVTIPNRLADAEDEPVDWSFADEHAQPVAEIYQQRGSYEALDAPLRARGSAPVPGDYLQDAWQRGVVIGVVASPGYGGGAAKTGVWATELTRSGILDALRARRTFGSTGPRVTLDFRANGHLMGGKVPVRAETVEVRVRLICPGEIANVEILRNNQVIHTTKPGGRSVELTYLDRQPASGASHNYVRVTQSDGEMAWSSPIWFGVR